MKKIFILMMALMMSLGMNAQVATQNSKLFDNTYVGVEVGATTPLSFDNVFPLNTVAGLKLGKELTPVFGLEAEGQVFFNENHFTPWTSTFVKGTNVGLNGVTNLSNLFGGYKGTPRLFEVKTNTGLGWLHFWNTSANSLTAKTAVDFAFNLGKKKAHTISVTPGIWWDLHAIDKIQFNKNFAQFGVFVGYTYHFKTSNGTHHFKTYDVGAMLDEINMLKEDLAKKPKEVVVDKVVEKVVEKPVTVATKAPVYVFFAQNSAELSDTAKQTLDTVEGTVEVTATASPEGTKQYNQKLSERRANVVKDYLEARNVKVTKAEGLGVTGKDSGRVAVVVVAE